MSVLLFVLSLLLQPSSVTSARMREDAAIMEHEEDDLCIGCNTYPEAPDYEDDWREEVGLMKTLEKLQDNEEGQQLSEEEKMTALLTRLEMAVHGIFEAVQGQACMDLCAVCMPSKENLASGATKLNTVHITRAKNWQDASIWPVVGTVDGTLGAVVGTVGAIPAALAGFFVGGGITGGAVGGATGGFIANKTSSSFAGNILGLIAGVSTFAISAPTYAAAIELLGLAAGVWKGVGITKYTTDCKRVGFERFSDGGPQDKGSYNEQPFTSKSWNSNYGLKRLRQWMKDNADWKENIAREEILPGDEEAIHHCERVREHSFDIRHARECMKHSQMCGAGGTFLLPVPSKSMCESISDISWLEKQAVEFGDDPHEGFFAQWRQFQEAIRNATGVDGKEAQCVRTLCEYGGFRKASLKLHPDRVMNKDIPEEEKQRLTNIFSFLSSCKTEYKGTDGEELTLNKKDERDQVCAIFDNAK